MNILMSTFVRGLIAVVPVFLSIYILFLIVGGIESLIDSTILMSQPQMQALPGLGLLLALAIVFTAGTWVSNPALLQIYSFFEKPFKKIPGLKTLYGGIQDLAGLFEKTDSAKGRKAVLVQPPNLPSFYGIQTSSLSDHLETGVGNPALVNIFVPMSYALGGYTIAVPVDWVQVLPMSPEALIKGASTGWVSRKKQVLAEPIPLPVGTANSEAAFVAKEIAK